MLLCMNQLLFDDEEYYFQITDELESDRQFILIIYDIVDNKRRTKFAKLLEGYGKRVQKSAFEAMLSEKNYYKLIRFQHTLTEMERIVCGFTKLQEREKSSPGE